MTKSSTARDTFKRLFEAGIRNKRVIAMSCHVSPRTVYNYLRMAEKGEDMTPKFAKPIPRKFTATVRRSLAQFLARNPRHHSEQASRYLSDHFGGTFSSSGVRKVLKQMGYKHGENKRTNLTSANKKVRLSWCNEHRNTDWKRLWSFDEAYFLLDPSSGQTWWKNGVARRVAIRKLTEKQEKLSIGIVVAISHTRKSAICYLPRNWPLQFVPILENELLPSVGWDPDLRRCRALLLDNDGRHRNKEVKKVLNEYGCDRIGYLPSNSPDLNPVENVFSIMKRSVRAKAPSTEAELRQAIVEAWDALKPETLRNLFASMPGRINQVMAKKGDRIKY